MTPRTPKTPITGSKPGVGVFLFNGNWQVRSEFYSLGLAPDGPPLVHTLNLTLFTFNRPVPL